MSPFERAVLIVLEASSEPLGWYALEMPLSNMALKDRSSLPNTLQSLVVNGWILSASAANSTTYVITQLGRAAFHAER